MNYNLTRHYDIVNEKKKPHPCNVCDTRKVTDLGCSFCGKEFTMKQELKDHVATDHKEKSMNVQNVRPHTGHIFHY